VTEIGRKRRVGERHRATAAPAGNVPKNAQSIGGAVNGEDGSRVNWIALAVMMPDERLPPPQK